MNMIRTALLALGAGLLFFPVLPTNAHSQPSGCNGTLVVVTPNPWQPHNQTAYCYGHSAQAEKSRHRIRTAKAPLPKKAVPVDTELSMIPIPMARPAELDADVEALVPSPVIAVTRSELAEASVTRVKVTILPVTEKPLWPEGFGPEGTCGSGYYPSGAATTVLVQGCLQNTSVTWLDDVPVQSLFLNLGYAAVQLSSMPTGCLALVEAVRMPATANVGFRGHWVKPDYMVTPGRGALSFAGRTVDIDVSTLGYEHVAGSCKGQVNVVTRSQIELISLVELTDLFRGNRF